MIVNNPKTTKTNMELYKHTILTVIALAVIAIAARLWLQSMPLTLGGFLDARRDARAITDSAKRKDAFQEIRRRCAVVYVEDGSLSVTQ